MSLFLDTGFSEHNNRLDHGSCLTIVPHLGKSDAQGALLALAMDVITRSDHATAARSAAQSLGENYYAAPRDWGLKRAINESFQVVNQTLFSGSKRNRAVSLSILVLRRRHWAIGHAGTNRVWLLRDNELKLLTHDHVAPSVGRLSRVNNACGLNKTLNVDLSVGELHEGDVFALTASGVHNFIDSATIMGCLLADVSAQSTAENLMKRACAAGAKDAVYACVARLGKLPRENLVDREEDERRLPVIAPPALGTIVDNFRILDMLQRGSRDRLYKALDIDSGKTVTLKFPNPKYARDPSFAEQFLHEEWVGKRLNCPHLLTVLTPRSGRRTALYSVLAYQHGDNLSARLRRKGRFPVRETLFHARQILEAVGELHAKGVLHGDLRPKNILLDKQNKRLLLLSPGVIHTTPQAADKKISTASDGNRSYLAPELIDGNPATPASDVYAVGVMLYRFLTGKYPYGKVEPQRRDWGKFIPPTRYCADVPAWLSAVIEKACALDPRQRYPDTASLAQMLADDPKPSGIRHKSASMPARHESSPWALYVAMGLVTGMVISLALFLL